MFIIFGLLTLLIGVWLWFALPDSPITAKFLTERERTIAVGRLSTNQTGIKNTKHKPAQVIECLTDLKVWLLVLGIFWHNMTNSLQTNFLGLILKGFGYSTYEAVLLNLPSAAIAAVAILSVSLINMTKWADGKRIFLIIVLYIPGIVGTLILHLDTLTMSSRGVHLFAVYIVAAVAAAAGIQYSLLASNVAGYTKKTVASVLFFASYCVANIVSPQTFITAQAPTYTTGITVTLAAFCINIVIFAVLYILYFVENRRRDRDAENCVGGDAGEDLVDAFSDLTDKQNLKLRYKL